MTWTNATFGRRLGAFLIDQFTWAITTFILGLLYYFLTRSTEPGLFIYLLFYFLYGAYFILPIWKYGATPGKKALGIKVTRTDGSSLGFWRVVLRETIGKWLSSILYIGYLWVIWDKNKQAWHDKIADTKVVTNKVSGDGKESPWIFVIVGLVIAFVVITILAVVVISAIDPSRKVSQARDAKRKNDLKTVEIALKEYYLDKKVYPENLETLVPHYLPSVPKDPSESQTYKYTTDGKNNYKFCAQLDAYDDGATDGSGKEECVSN
ncbi:MAG TPA: RDD family protein [Alphaproteobacteria bacterium]|jgi:uncharacterized RDD family membrane protein YckC/Tfp pilus assembly protein PilE|nr:RDD family protein [Alphaproteobacteria bacterium]